MVVRLNLLAHIIILMFQLQYRSSLTIFGIDEIDAFLNQSFLLFEKLHVVVADDIRECSSLNLSLEADKVEEALVSACVFRTLLHWKQSMKFHSNQRCISHFALCGSRMYVASLDRDGCSCSIEVFVFQFSDRAAVHCISILGTELCNIEFHDSASDLLVWSEAYLDFSMLEFRVLHYILHCIHDFCNSRLVICTEQSCSICSDQCLAHILKHLREIAWLEIKSWYALECDLASVIVFNNLWFDIGSGCVRCCVNVCNESDSRHISLFAVCRNRCHYISVFIKCGFHSHRNQLVAKHLQKVKLPGCTRLSL